METNLNHSSQDMQEVIEVDSIKYEHSSQSSGFGDSSQDIPGDFVGGEGSEGGLNPFDTADVKDDVDYGDEDLLIPGTSAESSLGNESKGKNRCHVH